MGAAPSLASSTQHSIDNWLVDYDPTESNRYADAFEHYDRVLERLLAGEPEGSDGAGGTRSAQFAPQNLAAVAAAGRANRQALDAGVRFGSPAAVAEQALLELAAAGAASLPPHAHVLEQRLLALRGLHAHFAVASAAGGGGFGGGSVPGSRSGLLGASKAADKQAAEADGGEDGSGFESPAEYNSTHQVYICYIFRCAFKVLFGGPGGGNLVKAGLPHQASDCLRHLLCQ
jgi:hypothetical protein